MKTLRPWLGAAFFTAMLAVCLAHADSTAFTQEEKLQKRLATLQQSIDRLTGVRDSLVAEVRSLKQELRDAQRAVAAATNQVITIKITFPSGGAKAEVKAEQE